MKGVFEGILTGYFSLLGDMCKALFPVDKAMTKLNFMHCVILLLFLVGIHWNDVYNMNQLIAPDRLLVSI